MSYLCNKGFKLAVSGLLFCVVLPSGSQFQLKEEIMSVFLIADIKVTDDGWVPEYAGNVHKIVEKHGGKYLSRSGNISTLEGAEKDSTLIAILEFPTPQRSTVLLRTLSTLLMDKHDKREASATSMLLTIPILRVQFLI